MILQSFRFVNYLSSRLIGPPCCFVLDYGLDLIAASFAKVVIDSAFHNEVNARGVLGIQLRFPCHYHLFT